MDIKEKAARMRKANNGNPAANSSRPGSNPTDEDFFRQAAAASASPAAAHADARGARARAQPAGGERPTKIRKKGQKKTATHSAAAAAAAAGGKPQQLQRPHRTLHSM